MMHVIMFSVIMLTGHYAECRSAKLEIIIYDIEEKSTENDKFARFMSSEPMFSNGRESTVNRALDGSIYPG